LRDAPRRFTVRRKFDERGARMDPLSHSVLGASLAQTRAAGRLPLALALGAVASVAPDLDVLIRSSSDPLLLLEYHRGFTHALAFAPIGALACAALLDHWARVYLAFRRTYLFCLLGYLSHCLLDACTSYGTQLLWPFSSERVAWSIVAAVDPAFTLPLLVLVVFAARRGRATYAWAAVVWALVYLGLGAIQQHRAEAAGAAHARDRGHTPARLEAKPALGTVLLWKVIYEHAGRYYVDGVRVAVDAEIYPGESIAKVDVQRDFPWLDPRSRQADDIERFRRVADDFLGLDSGKGLVVDLRYSMVPNEIAGFWGIALDRDAPATAHVEFVTTIETTPNAAIRLIEMIF
jgi:inner membrane protein